jgi:hypothetical protein
MKQVVCDEHAVMGEAPLPGDGCPDERLSLTSTGESSGSTSAIAPTNWELLSW